MPPCMAARPSASGTLASTSLHPITIASRPRDERVDIATFFRGCLTARLPTRLPTRLQSPS